MFSEIQIFKDFSFPTTCNKIKLNIEETQIIATGNYLPQFKIFLFEDCCEFLERRMDAEIIDFCFVGKNSRKLAFLRDDKIIEFFDKHSSYYKLKIPNYGRNLERFSENIYFSTEYQIHRCDLELGKVSTILNSTDTINFFITSPYHGLKASCTSNGLEFIDTRTSEHIKKIDIGKNVITCDFDENLCLAFSTPDSFNIIDLRGDYIQKTIKSNNIKQIKRHRNNWFFIDPSGISMTDGNSIVDSIECENITTFDVKDGIIFTGMETGEVKSFHTGCTFMPEWCSHAERFVRE